MIPVRNGAAHLDEALASVAAQQVTGIEVVVVDDGSTDGSGAVAARRAGVSVLRQDPAGPAAARNLGLCRTTGRFVAFLDADDRWPAGRLHRMLDHLRSPPGTGVVLGRQVPLLEPGVERPDWFDEPAEWIPLPLRTGLAPQVPAMSMVARREVFARVGFFDPGLGVCEDLDWYVRAAEAGVVIDLLDDVVLERRIHERNLSHDQEAMTRGALAVLRRKLERSRRRDRCPTISVVIPCHDHGAYLDEALVSVLSQSRTPLEVVVVDDGSTDDTPEVAARWAPWVRLVRQAKGGVGSARNAATPHVVGDAVLWLDADDRLAPGALGRLADALAAGADIARGRIDEFLTPGLDAATVARLRVPQTGVDAPLIGGHLVRRQVLLEVGPFDETLGRGEGVDWLHRAATAGLATTVVDAVTVERRFHTGNSAMRDPGRDGEYLRVARAALARRRGAAADTTR